MRNLLASLWLCAPALALAQEPGSPPEEEIGAAPASASAAEPAAGSAAKAASDAVEPPPAEPGSEPAPSAPAEVRTQVLENPEVVDGIQLPAWTEITWRPTTDELIRVILAEPMEMWGLPLAARSEVRFDVSAAGGGVELRSVTVAEPVRVLGVPIRAGSSLTFACADAACADDPSSVASLRAATVARPHKAGDRRWPAGSYLVLDVFGRLQSVQLPRAEVERVAGVPLSSLGAITFHANGVLRSGYLARDTRLQGLVGREGREVLWNDRGELMELTLDRPREISGHEVPSGAVVGLFPSGELRFVRSIEPGEIAGLPLGPKTAGVVFHDNGSVASIVTDEDFLWDGIAVDGGLGYRVQFDREQRLRVARLAEPVEQGGVVLPAGTYVGVDEAGQLRELSAEEVQDR